MSPDLLKPADVAQRLSVSRSTVYDLLARGEIRAVRVRSAVRIEPAEIARYLESLRRERDRLERDARATVRRFAS